MNDLSDLKTVMAVAEDGSNPFTLGTLRKWIFKDYLGFREQCTVKIGTRLLYIDTAAFVEWLAANHAYRAS